MNSWEAIFLGALQGATEFLPVSSSGHLVIAQVVLGIAVTGIAFEMAVHLATLVSVVVALRERIRKLVRGAFSRDPDSWRYLGLLFLATLPVAVVGFLGKEAIEVLFDRPIIPGPGLMVTGTLLLSLRFLGRRGGVSSTEAREARDPGGTPTLKQALLMGFAQVAALVPGISRSGSTVVAGLWGGVDPEEAATFSFLMGIPAILGGGLLLADEVSAGLTGAGAVPLALGFFTASVVGVLAIRLFVALLRKGSFHQFGIYCWTVGGAFLLYVLLG